ncbi:MAG: BatA domain-containing protein [Planctomycetes bacterium]|nr:BatA domain-containing protein [Planctomycetota bacterium]
MFDYPVFLYALPILALPFLLKLIKPPKPTKIPFSQMYLLERVMKNFQPLKKRSPWLLYLIRMLILAVLLMLLAGYLFEQGGGSTAVSLVMIVDDSFYAHSRSQSGEYLWDEIREDARSKLLHLPVGSATALIGVSGASTGWSSPLEMRRHLAKKKATYLGENWMKVRRELRRLVRSREHGELSVWVFSEGKWSYSDEYNRTLETLPNEAKIRVEAKEREWLDNAWLKLSFFSEEKSLILKGQISGVGNGTVDVKLSSPEGVEELFSVELREGRGEFTKKVSKTVFHTGMVELLLFDRLQLDNRVYYSVNSRSSLNVILLNHRQAEERLQDVGYYLKKGIKTITTNSLLQLVSREPKYWQALHGAPGDVVILHDPPFLAKDEADMLIKFVKSGGQLLLIPGPFTPEDLFKERFGHYMPAELKETVNRPQRIQFDEEWARSCPRLAESELRGKWLFYRMNPQAKTLLRFDDGSPLWMSSKVGNGQVHLLSSPFHIVWSDAVILSDFPVLLEKVIRKANPQWADFEEALELVPGKIFPASLSSYRALMTQSEAESSSEVELGIYSCQLNNGRSLTLPANFEADWVLPRSEPAQLSKDERESLASLTPGKRDDRLWAFCLTVLILIEGFYLLWRKRSVS